MIAPPPKLDELRAGTELIAGIGKSSIIADFDFETYSEAGFLWNDATKKYDAPPPAGNKVKGLPVIGAPAYAAHPSTEVLCLAYDLKDGRGKRQWRPGEPLPTDLFTHIKNHQLLEAWNVMFEYLIWAYVCVPKYGFPPLPAWILRDAMAKARAFALPGRLGQCGEVLKIEKAKNPDGMRLIRKFSMPRNPTKNKPETRTRPEDDPADFQNMLDYNLRDIEAEAEISSKIPDLPPMENEFWKKDFAINIRGVQVDLTSVRHAIRIIETAYEKYNSQLRDITGGAVEAASEVAKLTKWLMQNSTVHAIESLDADNVDRLLEVEDRPHVRRVLEIRRDLSSAAVKKLYSMMNSATPDGRLSDLLVYHSARTGREAGKGVQPQNLPNSGAYVALCDHCGYHYFQGLTVCPWCAKSGHTVVEWNTKAVEDAIVTIQTGNLSCMEMFWGDAIGTIAGCLRGMITSKPGHDLICSDYSAIEAVVLAALAGEEWRLEVFRTHGKIYEMSASKITGIPFEEFERHKQETGSHHPMRKKVGKVAELACFSPDTQVLTHRGYVGIKDVLSTDKLWDGFEWVTHQGVVYKGKRGVIRLDGVRMTPTHPINCGGFWKAAKQLVLNKNILARALEIGSANLPFSNVQHPIKSKFNALVTRSRTRWNLRIYGAVNRLAVTGALKRNLKKLTINCTRNINILYRTLSIVAAYSIGLARHVLVAILNLTNNITLTAVAESSSMTHGGTIEANFLNMQSRLKAGIIPTWKWIVSTATVTTNRAISGLCLVKKILKTNEAYTILKRVFENSSDVYDIVNAGSRHQFTIKTDSGHLIVHNSGYQGWIGAWKAFGADEFFSEDEIKNAVLAWRNASPNIVEFWGGQQRYRQTEYYGLEGAAIQAVISPGEKFSHNGITYFVSRDILYCQLLSGRCLVYHAPRLEISDRRPGTQTLSFEGWNSNPKYGKIGWIRMRTYGGKLTENVVQATARDILTNAIVNLENAGYPVVLHVHDEIVAEVPEGHGSVEEFERIMSTMPHWAKHFPIKAKGGWRAKRYAK